MNDEILEIVDKDGNVLSVAPRGKIHGNPALMHRVVHVLVSDNNGSIYLQKRSMNKDVAPGKWDTSVGGHVERGEDLETAALREMQEELGIKCKLEYLYSYVHSNQYETEQVHTYRCTHHGPVTFNRQEIDEVRPWSIQEITKAMGSGVLSDNFEHEFKTYLEHEASR